MRTTPDPPDKPLDLTRGKIKPQEAPKPDPVREFEKTAHELYRGYIKPVRTEDNCND